LVTFPLWMEEEEEEGAVEKRRKRRILPARPHRCALLNLTPGKRCAKPHWVCGDMLFVHIIITTINKLITSRPKEENLAS